LRAPAGWSKYFAVDVQFVVVVVVVLDIDLVEASCCGVVVMWFEVERVLSLKGCVESDLFEGTAAVVVGAHETAQVVSVHQQLRKMEPVHYAVEDKLEKSSAGGRMVLKLVIMELHQNWDEANLVAEGLVHKISEGFAAVVHLGMGSLLHNPELDVHIGSLVESES